MGRKKLLGIAALLSALIVPLAVGANFINVANLPLFGSLVTPLSSTTVFVDPPHVLNETLQAGSKFTVHVNVSDVTDLFTWQASMNWDSSILNVSRIIPGEFLARATEQTSSEALGDVVINATDNAQGHGLFAESILGNVSGIPGPASGRLVSIEFLVLDYGWTDLNISLSEDFPATLLNSAGNDLTFTAVNGYFSNKMPGDIDGDKDVDPFDFNSFRLAYASKAPPQVPEPTANYNRQADFDLDGDVDPFDFNTFRLNYARKM